MLLPLPDTSGAEIHTLGERTSQGSEAQQPVTQHNLRP